MPTPILDEQGSFVGGEFMCVSFLGAELQGNTGRFPHWGLQGAIWADIYRGRNQEVPPCWCCSVGLNSGLGLELPWAGPQDKGKSLFQKF